MDTAGIRTALANAIRQDVWFGDGWHFPGMARAAEIVEKGEVMIISPQEPGTSTTTPQHPFEYWNKKIRADVVEEIRTVLDGITDPLDKEFSYGLLRAIEIVDGA